MLKIDKNCKKLTKSSKDFTFYLKINSITSFLLYIKLNIYIIYID